MHHNERVYHLQLGTLIRQSITYGFYTLISIIVTIFVIFFDRSVEIGWTIGLGIFLSLVTFVVFALFYDAASRIPKKERIALGISGAGLRIPDAKKTVAPDEIKAVYIMAVSLGASSNSDVNRIGRVNVPHIRVMRYGGDPFTGAGKDARCYMTAYADQLVGGPYTYIELCRDLIEWGKAHNVRVAYIEQGDQSIYEAIGSPTIAPLSELDYMGEPTSQKSS